MTRQISVGGVKIGGGAPVSIQSMLKAPLKDWDRIQSQLLSLEEAGCDIIRAAVPDEESARALRRLRSATKMPMVADIHFDYRLALLACENGADKIRINPGNIGSDEGVRAVAAACGERKIPIRIGVNGGSLEKRLLEKYGGVTAEALAQSALEQARLLEDCGFYDICISVKASNAPLCVKACRLLREKSDYPLHLGVTEAGAGDAARMKAAVGIGSLLLDGIGDTIRISLTEEPYKEAEAARELLKILGLRRTGVEFISCPTCGRTAIDLMRIRAEVEAGLKDILQPITVAVMGCVVNGPGEASRADFGLAGGEGEGVIFQKGEIIKKVSQNRLAEELIETVRKSIDERT